MMQMARSSVLETHGTGPTSRLAGGDHSSWRYSANKWCKWYDSNIRPRTYQIRSLTNCDTLAYNGASAGNRTLNLVITSHAHYQIVLRKHNVGGFCVGGTHNPTSTNASFAKRPDVVYTPHMRESAVAVSRRLRPNDALVTFATVTTFPLFSLLYTSYHFRGSVESNHPISIQNKKVFFVLSISIRPIVAILAHPRVRGSLRRRGVFVWTISNWQKVNRAIRAKLYPPISLLTDTRPRLAIAGWLRHAYLPTHGCHTFRLCANVLFGVSVKG